MQSVGLPLDLRSANLSAIYKKGSKCEASSYRPRSLTCICCKLMKSIIRDKIVEFFSSSKLFSNKHYGFIKSPSTELQLLKILDDGTDQLVSGGQIDVMYTHLEKGFDRIPHRKL